MNTITNKALVVAVGIFITIAITSAILITIDLMRDVYSDVYETDITISSGFQEYDQYDGTTKTGLDLLNALNKYYNSSNVKITVKSNGIERQEQNMDIDDIKKYDPEEGSTINQYNYSYACSVTKNNNIVTITFNKP